MIIIADIKQVETCDPSANVIMLVENAIKYLEDLHRQGVIYHEAKLEMAVEASRRERKTETERVNDLRSVDIAAVATANERTIKQAEVLATQLAKTAETIAAQLTEVTNQLLNRIAALEKVQYENQGKSGASSTLLDRVSDLELSKSEIRGASQGSALTAAQLRNTLGVFLTVLSILALIFKLIYP